MFYKRYKRYLTQHAWRYRHVKPRALERYYRNMRRKAYSPTSHTGFHLHKLVYTTNRGGGFFFNFTELKRVAAEYNHIPFVVPSGHGGYARKSERRSITNILSWWNYIFSVFLPHTYFVDLRLDTRMLLLFFYGFNNMSLRYLFMNELYVRNIYSVPALYFFRYNFYTRNFVQKKITHLKKYKKKAWVHADRFDRREYWART